MPDYQDILNRATSEASDFVNNPARMDILIVQLEEKLSQVPAIGEMVSELPTLISMVKCWIKKEYQVSPKVLATIAGAFLYLVKKRDLIPDSIPVIGIADDVAVLGLALKFVAPEVQAFKSWRDSRPV